MKIFKDNVKQNLLHTGGECACNAEGEETCWRRQVLAGIFAPSSSFVRGVLNTQHLYMILPNPNNLMSLTWPYLATILVST